MALFPGRRRVLFVAGIAALFAAVLAATSAVVLIRADSGGGSAPGAAGSPQARAPLPDGSPSGTVGSHAAGASGPTAPNLTVRYRLDGTLTGAIHDEGRHLPLKVSTAAGGGLTTEPRRGGGRAVRFPAPCPNYGSANCPRAILESGPAGSLNPGTGPVRFGAAVRLAANETAIGENVLQKGYSQGSGSARDGQFKLQVDGAAGRPGCVLVGRRAAEIHVLTATASVADGQWHVVECARIGGSLTIAVDGAVVGRRTVPEGLSIVNDEPLRIGGKGTGPNNDQFHGAIDDVFVTIGG